jgi:hypothetical protein
MKTAEIATRSAEAIVLAAVADMLQQDFDYVDMEVLKELADKVESLMDEVAKPVQDLIVEEKKL